MPTVKELKAELAVLNLSTDGKKSVLEHRLKLALTPKGTPKEEQIKTFLQAKREYAEMQARDFNKRFASK